MSLVKRILIANRGEIACRIIRTAKRYRSNNLDWEFKQLPFTVILIEIRNSLTWQTDPSE